MRIDNFKGINNVAKDIKTPDGYLKQIINFDVDNSGLLRQRKGYALKISGDVTALWSDGIRCFAVVDSNFVEVHDNYTTTTIQASVGDITPSFVNIDGVYYYVSERSTGRIVGTTHTCFGMPKISMLPTLTETTGVLQSGRYQVAFTAIDADGIESGTGISSVISVSENAGITVSAFQDSLDSRVSKLRLYLSEADGEVLYHYADIALNVTTLTIRHFSGNTTPLNSFGIDAAPLGQIIQYYNGRAYIASNNLLYYSEPGQYERWDYRNYIAYPSRITAVLPLDNGIWVSADKLYWLDGNDADKFTQVVKHTDTLYERSEALLLPEFINFQNVPSSRAWQVLSKRGIMMLFNGGIMMDVSQDTLKLPVMDSAVGAFVQDNDAAKYVAITKNGNDSDNEAFLTAEFSGTISRNGVVISE